MRGLLVAVAVLAGAILAPAAQSQERIGGGSPIDGGLYRGQMVQVLAGDRAVCTGVFLSDRWVLTAANCFDRIGVGIRVQHLTGVTAVHWVLRHPEYNQATLANDIALLQLAEDVSGVLGAAVASGNPKAGARVMVAGFGASDDGTSGAARIGVQTALGPDACGRVAVGTTAGTRWCAGQGDDAATCRGDVGGPAFDDTGAVAGITSVSSPGCARGDVSVYTSVSAYRAWIVEHVIGNGGRSGWYRQDGAEFQGWIIEFYGARARLATMGYDALTGAPTWTVTTLIRTASGVYEGGPWACQDRGGKRGCNATGDTLAMTLRTDGRILLRSMPDGSQRLLVASPP